LIRYIDAHRAEFPVEPICEVLEIAESTYYAAKKRAPSARAVRDADLVVEIAGCGRRTSVSTGRERCGGN
jgi:putative transposase